MMEFILSERLEWCVEDLVSGKGKGMFAKEGDLRILWNDWPYGLDERIVHLVVWTKFELEEDVRTGDLRGSVRGEIEGFVERVFGRRVGAENVSILISFFFFFFSAFPVFMFFSGCLLFEEGGFFSFFCVYFGFGILGIFREVLSLLKRDICNLQPYLKPQPKPK